MMDLPRLKKTIDGRKQQRATTFNQTLGGYNHNLRTKAGEFYDMKNISLDNYPVIGERQGIVARYLEYTVLEEGDSHGLHEYQDDTLMAVFGKTLHVGITEDDDGSVVSGSASLLSDTEKSFATIGTKTLIMPDKAIYDSKEETLFKFETTLHDETIEIEGTQDVVYLLFRTLPCDIDGTVNWNIVESTSEPSNPVDGMWWYNYGDGSAATAVSSDPNEIVETLIRDKGWWKYDADDSKWVKLEKPYTLLLPCLSTSNEKYTKYTTPLDCLEEINDFFTNLAVLDSFGMKLPTETAGEYEEDYTDYAVYGKYVNYNADWDLDLCGVVIAKQATTNITGYKVGIRCPNLKHIFALNNRIWGVNPDEHEIFCCKLGNPTQWYNYADVASDSFAVSLGNDKEITAGCAYKNSPHFFTEDSIIRIYGDYPSNYQLYTTKADGVVFGGHDTLAQVEGILFWVSPNGVVAYEGSLPYFVGQDFEPNFLFDKTVAGGKDGSKYCLSVSWGEYNQGIYTFDTRTGMWARFAEDVIVKAAELKNALCYINKQKQFVTLYDRSMALDKIPLLVNLFDMSNRKKGTFINDLSESKYYYPLGIKTDESGEGEYDPFEIPSDYETTASIEDDVLTVKAKIEYWEDSEYDGKDYGICFPIEVHAGDKYAIYYDTDDEDYGHVHASIWNGAKALVGGAKDIASGDKITMPSGAAWLLLVFCQRSLTENNFSNIVVRNIGEYWDHENRFIEWELETGNLGLDTPDQKYISRVQMRLDFHGSLNVDISYDDSEYFPVHVSESDHMKSITVPIKVRRCDHFKLKLSGEGRMRLYSLGYETDEGSARCLI